MSCFIEITHIRKYNNAYILYLWDLSYIKSPNTSCNMMKNYNWKSKWFIYLITGKNLWMPCFPVTVSLVQIYILNQASILLVNLSISQETEMSVLKESSCLCCLLFLKILSCFMTLFNWSFERFILYRF